MNTVSMIRWRCIPWYDEGEDYPESYGTEEYIDAPDKDAAFEAICERTRREDPGHNVTGWNIYRADDPEKPWEQL